MSIQFKEGQAQRRVKTLKSQLESAQQFTLEAELAMRTELGALRDQLDHVSAQLLKKDEKNERLRGEVSTALGLYPTHTLNSPQIKKT